MATHVSLRWSILLTKVSGTDLQQGAALVCRVWKRKYVAHCGSVHKVVHDVFGGKSGAPWRDKTMDVGPVSDDSDVGDCPFTISPFIVKIFNVFDLFIAETFSGCQSKRHISRTGISVRSPIWSLKVHTSKWETHSLSVPQVNFLISPFERSDVSNISSSIFQSLLFNQARTHVDNSVFKSALLDSTHGKSLRE